uniref:Uncharacterized protein n=1 Tax=Molossus molossus TaxID=27622 RepID=A0A7J8BYD1_MOLMO|nr:hypothetical protein HJG59_010017 [Molossus molossus]
MFWAITVIETPIRAISFLRDAIVIGTLRGPILLTQMQSHSCLEKQWFNQMSCEGKWAGWKDREEQRIALTVRSDNITGSDHATCQPASPWELCFVPNGRLVSLRKSCCLDSLSLLDGVTPKTFIGQPQTYILNVTSSSPCSWGHTKVLACP